MVVRGDLRMFPDIDRPEVIRSLEYLWIGGKKYRLMSCRPHKNIYILHVEGVEDRNQTELMRGMEAKCLHRRCQSGQTAPTTTTSF